MPSRKADDRKPILVDKDMHTDLKKICIEEEVTLRQLARLIFGYAIPAIRSGDLCLTDASVSKAQKHHPKPPKRKRHA